MTEEKYMIGGHDCKRAQDLMREMRILFDKGQLTIWQFSEFKLMCIAYAKNSNGKFNFDYNTEQFWQTEEQYYR